MCEWWLVVISDLYFQIYIKISNLFEKSSSTYQKSSTTVLHSLTCKQFFRGRQALTAAVSQSCHKPKTANFCVINKTNITSKAPNLKEGPDYMKSL